MDNVLASHTLIYTLLHEFSKKEKKKKERNRTTRLIILK